MILRYTWKPAKEPTDWAFTDHGNRFFRLRVSALHRLCPRLAHRRLQRLRMGRLGAQSREAGVPRAMGSPMGPQRAKGSLRL